MKRSKLDGSPIKTTFAPGFDGFKKIEELKMETKTTRKYTTPETVVDVDSLKISHTPMPDSKEGRAHKYAKLFEKMIPGDCIECESHQTNAIAQSLAGWIARNKIKNRVARSKTKWPTPTEGRVWLIKK